MEKLFDNNISEADITSFLTKKEFKKINEGFSAHIFGATDMSVVLKIFPGLNIGSPQRMDFINKSSVLKMSDDLTARFQNNRLFRWLRQKAKHIVIYLKQKENPGMRIDHSDLAVKGYEAIINKGLTTDLFTRVIPNCITMLNIRASRGMMLYYEKPKKIILQERFSDKILLSEKIKNSVNNVEVYKKLIKDAIDYQIFLWGKGVADTDMSFNIFDNLIVLPDSRIQIHDANDITENINNALWFIREKEKDISDIFKFLDEGNCNQLVKKRLHNGIPETVQKLGSKLPGHCREEMIMFFLDELREILSEEFFLSNWGKNI